MPVTVAQWGSSVAGVTVIVQSVVVMVVAVTDSSHRDVTMMARWRSCGASINHGPVCVPGCDGGGGRNVTVWWRLSQCARGTAHLIAVTCS